MLVLFRPYCSAVKTAYCLSRDDRAMMKINCSLVVKVIMERMGWMKESKVSEIHKNDEFVRMYWNDGVPYMNILLEYYYSIYLYSLKSCGEKVDFLKEAESLHRQHKEECNDGDFWNEKHALTHRLYLLNYDRSWYKRHFRKYCESMCVDSRLLKLVDNGVPVTIDESKIRRMEDVEANDS